MSFTKGRYPLPKVRLGKVAAMVGKVGGVGELVGRRSTDVTADLLASKTANLTATKVLSGARILFGAIFLFDGIMKWVLFQQGTMQGVVQSSVSGYGATFIANNWVAFGVVIGVGETLAGLALMVGLFQRPAAIAAAGIMGFIWGYGGFGGFGSPGYTDPGGDLMLGLVFVVFAFAPAAYGLASRLRLPSRFAGSTLRNRVLRFLIA